MKPIVTLTLNPAIDASCQAEEVRPIHKIRTSHERYDPGGGGINVARVIRELGGEAIAVYLRRRPDRRGLRPDDRGDRASSAGRSASPG